MTRRIHSESPCDSKPGGLVMEWVRRFNSKLLHALLELRLQEPVRCQST